MFKDCDYVMKNFNQDFLLKLKRQDHSSFNEFYLKTVDMFFRYTKSNFFLSDEEVEDVISHFFVKYRQNLPHLDLKKSFSAYTWTIFKNTLKDYFKKTKEFNFSSLDSEDTSNSFADEILDEASIQEILNTDFQVQYIQDAMQKLDDISRDIIHLRYIEQKSYSEIAEFLQLSPDNIRQKSSRAIKQLKT
ncbi:MAG: sigma-70 family RNA polymerase sigma factor, partial [bacterium]|nr:sigma-70 family RNA polymerase sigma factor [bacterium]